MSCKEVTHDCCRQALGITNDPQGTGEFEGPLGGLWASACTWTCSVASPACGLVPWSRLPAQKAWKGSAGPSPCCSPHPNLQTCLILTSRHQCQLRDDVLMFNVRRLLPRVSLCLRRREGSTATTLRGPGLQEKTTLLRKAAGRGREERVNSCRSSPQPGKAQSSAETLCISNSDKIDRQAKPCSQA